MIRPYRDPTACPGKNADRAPFETLAAACLGMMKPSAPDRSKASPHDDAAGSAKMTTEHVAIG